jgi:hypothetical protein
MSDSLLDANLVLRKAFDEATGKLKVDATVTTTIGNVEVVIDAAGGDNIAIKSADGTKTLDINADGSINANVVIDRNDVITTFGADEAIRIDDASTVNVTYFGFATVGVSPASASWKIYKIDESTGFIKQYADGDALYNNIWNNRTSLIYT